MKSLQGAAMRFCWPWLMGLCAAMLWSCGDDAEFVGKGASFLPGSEQDEGDEDVQDPPREGDPSLDADPRNPDGGPPDDNPPDPPAPPLPPGTAGLHWQLDCQPDPDTAADLRGFGDHDVAVPDADTIQLTAAGALCAPDAGPRDIVFVVDVSDSMRGFFNTGNDPLRNGRCGRMDAVAAVLAGLSDQARVGLVTFDGGLEESTPDFLDVASFRQNWLNANTLCFRGANTSFRAGLNEAEDLLTRARPDAQQEIYFISDGEPASEGAIGKDVAARLRDQATIATLMLRGDDDVLIDFIASRDGQGQALHARAEDATQLSDALAKLAMTSLTQATLRVQLDGATWQEHSIDLAAGLAFQGGPWLLDPSSNAVLELQTTDSRGRQKTQQGQLLWLP